MPHCCGLGVEGMRNSFKFNDYGKEKMYESLLYFIVIVLQLERYTLFFLIHTFKSDRIGSFEKKLKKGKREREVRMLKGSGSVQSTGEGLALGYTKCSFSLLIGETQERIQDSC